jgi:plastocyanin
MKRLLIVIPIAVVAAAVAWSGAFAAGRAGRAVAASSMPPMRMPMPNTASALGHLRLDLHQRVVRLKIMNFAFMPARVEVSPGTRLLWTNEDSDPHTVASDKPGFASQALDTGQTYSKVLTRPGTFAYHCMIHPFMHGVVTVAR